MEQTDRQRKPPRWEGMSSICIWTKPRGAGGGVAHTLEGTAKNWLMILAPKAFLLTPASFLHKRGPLAALERVSARAPLQSSTPQAGPSSRGDTLPGPFLSGWHPFLIIFIILRSSCELHSRKGHSRLRPSLLAAA